MATRAAPRARSIDLARSLSRLTAMRTAGAMLALAGAIILLGIISAEALYPAPYSTAANEISDLGGTTPLDGGIVYQPSSTIFNVSMIAAGLTVLVAGLLVHRALGRRSVTIPVMVLGVGALGVGVFPGPTGTIHALFAMTTFVSGGVAALTGGRAATGAFRYVSLLLGATALVTLGSYVLLGEGSPFAALGMGGLERWIAYPIVIWVTAFGGWLAGRAES